MSSRDYQMRQSTRDIPMDMDLRNLKDNGYLKLPRTATAYGENACFKPRSGDGAGAGSIRDKEVGTDDCLKSLQNAGPQSYFRRMKLTD